MSPRIADAPPLPTGRSTPFLVVDAEVMDANLSKVHRRLRDQGLHVRPHAKTPTCMPVAARGAST